MPETRTRTARRAAASHPANAAIVLIAQEGPREHIGAILEEQRLEYVAFDHVEDLLEHPTDEAPALAVLWIEGAICSPVHQIDQLRGGLEQTRLVVICAGIQRWGMRAALAGGVVGVVLEEEMADTLYPCLRAVQAGQICMPQRHWQHIEPPALSTREKQILGLVVMGYMNGQIAERLFLAESTIKSHLSSAFAKLGVRSRNEAVEFILDPDRGLGVGILALGGEPLQPALTTAR